MNGIKITKDDSSDGFEKPMVMISKDVPAVAPDNPETPDQPEAETPETPQEEVTQEVDLDDSKVLSFFEKRFGKKLESVDDLLKEPEPQVVEKEIELEDDVAAFRKYKKETGRGLSDFMKLQRDFAAMSDDELLEEYYSIENPAWSKDDVRFSLKRKFGFDPEMLEEDEIKEKELLKKTEVAKAKEKLNALKEQYSTPLESRGLDVPEDVKAEFETFKQNKQQAAELQEASAKRSEVFVDKTLELFSDKFDGYEFSVGDNKSIKFKPDDPNNLIKKQTNIAEWLEGFKDENGYIKDINAFHKAISMAMYGEAAMKHAYEQGMADMVVEMEKQGKNIDMPKNPAQATTPTGLKISVLDSGSGNNGRLVIKSPTKSK